VQPTFGNNTYSKKNIKYSRKRIYKNSKFQNVHAKTHIAQTPSPESPLVTLLNVQLNLGKNTYLKNIKYSQKRIYKNSKLLNKLKKFLSLRNHNDY